MFKKIVLALDGSKGAEAGIPFARELARAGDGQIVIVHVNELIVGRGAGPIRADEEEVQAGIVPLAEELREDGIETEVRVADVMVGGPANVIASIANDVGADLIVAGTRGHTAIAGLLLGSVTQRLLHIADQPVLVVPARD